MIEKIRHNLGHIENIRIILELLENREVVKVVFGSSLMMAGWGIALNRISLNYFFNLLVNIIHKKEKSSYLINLNLEDRIDIHNIGK